EAKAEGDAPKAEAAAADMEAAKTLFTQRCVTCHGAEGKGDGPAGAALNPKPRTFSDAEWQGKVTDEHLSKVIIGGGPSVGLSPLMPPNPDLQAKPEVVAGLVKMIRGFGGK
ncbi:MAG: c-type cytochrome, partial [Myxococcales bacterium]|nr:c-type cytochrome [Myxococcales bacterium]